MYLYMHEDLFHNAIAKLITVYVSDRIVHIYFLAYKGCNQDETDEDCWEDQTESEDDTRPATGVDASADIKVNQHALHLITWTTTFLLMWQSAFNISGRAIASLLAFVGKFLVVLSRITSSPVIGLMAKLFPATLYGAHSHVNISEQSFTVYAVCGHCYAIYKLCQHDSADGDGLLASRRCNRLAFPNHKQTHRRITCNTPLYRKVRLSQGKFRYYQVNSYPFKSLKEV